MNFRTASMDTYTKVMTIRFIIFFSVVIFALVQSDQEFVFWPVSIMIAVIVTAYLMIPKIDLEQGSLKIKNTFVDIQVPVKSIKYVELITKTGFNLRTFGIGGLFGYFGYFNGNDVWYVTNVRKKVKIQTERKTYLISPEEPQKFINEIEKLKNNI